MMKYIEKYLYHIFAKYLYHIFALLFHVLLKMQFTNFGVTESKKKVFV